MKHVKRISNPRRADVDIEDVLQVVGLLNALLGLFTGLAETFGFAIPQKGGQEED